MWLVFFAITFFAWKGAEYENRRFAEMQSEIESLKADINRKS